MSAGTTADHFAAHALRLAGLVMRGTGWPPDTFWAATPAEVITVLAPDLTPFAEPPPLARADLIHLMETDNDRRSD